jgi:hypothetical protein
VLLAGSAAVAANIGILNAADSSTIGDLAATDDLLPAAGAGISTTTYTSAPHGDATQQYDIAGTATVWVMTTTSGLALDHVVAEPGWNPTLTQTDLRSLRVDFVNGDRTIVFTAAIGDDNVVVVDVTEPTTIVAATPSAPGATTDTIDPTASDRHDDDRDDDRDEDHDDDHDDDRDDDHDGHEYEGADDDD